MLCPHCHQEISAGSKFCNFCGKPIPQEVFCAKCGAKLPQGSRFCHLCGEAVNAVPAPDAEEEKRAAAEREEQARLREALHALDAEEQTLRQQLEQARAARQEVDAARTALHEESGVPAKPQNEPAPVAIHKKPVEKTVRPPRRRPAWFVPAAAGVAVLAVAAVVLALAFGKSENVKALEAQITSIGTVALDDRERIETAEKMQAALKPSELKKVGNLQALQEAREAYDAMYARQVSKDITDIEQRINAIGEVTLDSETALRSIRDRYDSAEAEVRQGISNYEVLTAAEETFSALQVAAVEQVIDAIGTVTLDSGDAIDEAESAYQALTDAQRQQVSNAEQIQAAKDRLKELEEAEAERLKDEALASLRKEEDKVQKITWYYPSAFPRYTDIRCYVLPYIGKNSSSAWLRLRMNYTSRDNWVFWEQITFSIDGSNTTYYYKYSDITRDNDTEVWEYNDIPVNDKELKLLNEIAESEETIVRFQGDDHYKDFTVSASDKAAIKQLLLAYEYLK